MTLISLGSPLATSIRHHDRGLTLVFGSDGQVSLIGYGSGLAPQAPYTLTASNTAVPTLSTPSFPSRSTLVPPIPNLEATSASLTSLSFSTPTPTGTPAPTSTSISSSLASSSYNSSFTATDTDTNLPSIPTVDYPTPSPTPVSNPRDHGVGAPFYLAIVLASISFIGCIAAFIAWWIRSRSRNHDPELDDPWNHRNTISDAGSPFTDNSHALEKGTQPHEARPYYLPASIVNRSSSNLLAAPDTISAFENGTPHNGASRTVLDPGPYSSLDRANGSRYQDPSSGASSYQNATSSHAASPYSRPGAERLQTGLSVQESTQTLGRLRVANRVPGDVTSGDEGGMNLKNTTQNSLSDPNERCAQEGDGSLEPPGPATLSWGRRTDTVAALRRTRRRTPGTTDPTYKNASYGGSFHSTSNVGQSSAAWNTPATTGQEEKGRIQANPQSDCLGWTNTLKSSFWQALDAVTSNRPPDPVPRAANTGSGSGFTPAPQRVASRHSLVSPIHPASSILPDSHATRLQGTETKGNLALSDRPVATQEISRNLIHSNIGNSSTRRDESEVSPINNDFSPDRVGSFALRVSRLNRDLSSNTRGRHSDSLRTETGSMYSTESAAARANLRKYGYGDSIPSSWSALGATRESQLDLDRGYLPLPRPISSSPRPLSATPSRLTLESGLLSSSTSMRTRTRTPTQSESDLLSLDAGTLRSGKRVDATSYEGTSSMYSVSRNGTSQSERGAIGHDAVPSHSMSTTSGMLSRKKGVTTRRKRPRLPSRAPSSASSVQSIESGLSTREIAVKRALLERRRKVKAAQSLEGRDGSLTHSRDASSFLV